MNILVTGGTGFLGTHLVNRLENLGHKVYISNTKKYNLDKIENLYELNDISFDYIFHLAAATKAGDYCLTHQGEQWENNQLLNTNMLIYWKDHQPQAKLISMGTSCSYPADLPMTEENYLVGLPGKDLYTYAMTKRMLLTGLMAFEKQYGLKWLCFIPSTLYGPGFEEHDNHFIFDLIRKIYNGKNYGDEVELWGDGYQRRELIYVDDAIDAMLNLLNEENQIFNLGSSNDLPIRHYAQEICNSFDYDHDKIFYNIEKYVGVRKRKLEVDKVQELSLNYCNTSLAEGLKKTAQFYSDNYGKNKKE
jgi:GDP-L-fucose synthase